MLAQLRDVPRSNDPLFHLGTMVRCIRDGDPQHHSRQQNRKRFDYPAALFSYVLHLYTLYSRYLTIVSRLNVRTTVSAR